MTPAPPPVIEEREPQVVVQNFGAYGITGGGTYRLKASIASSDTSVSLSSFKEPVSDLPYTMSYLNTTVGYGTIDPQTTRPEFISFTGITQNSDGSATLSGVTRGLTRSPQGISCTASSTLAVRHPGQSIFILSDSPCHFAEYGVKRNDETVTGQWSFPYPSASSSVASKGYVDQVALGSPTVDRLIVAGTAGETVSQGQVLYYNRFEGEWRKADADLASTSVNVLLGVAQGVGTDGVSISGGVMIQGLDPYQGSMTAGQRIYLSGTAGATSTSPGTFEKQLGVARNSTTLYFDPALMQNALYSQTASTTDLIVSRNATSTHATTTSLSINGVSYQWPTTQNASSSALSTDGSGLLSWAQPPARILVQDGTSYTTTSNATTTVYTYKIPAGTIPVTGGIKIEAMGYTAVTGNSVMGAQIQFGTGLASSTIAEQSNSTQSNFTPFQVWINNTNSASAQFTVFSAFNSNTLGYKASSTQTTVNTAADAYISFQARNIDNTGAAVGFRGITIWRLAQ